MPRPDRSAALDHIVVVMFENRSFDNLLGRLYHVPPPAAPPPDPAAPAGQLGFRFDRSGVRVPAIAVSAWIPDTTVINDEYRHTSVIRTLRERWHADRPRRRGPRPGPHPVPGPPAGPGRLAQGHAAACSPVQPGPAAARGTPAGPGQSGLLPGPGARQAPGASRAGPQPGRSHRPRRRHGAHQRRRRAHVPRPARPGVALTCLLEIPADHGSASRLASRPDTQLMGP
jgi:Phosphoesterase family